MPGFGDDHLGPRVLGGAYKPPPEIPSSLVKAMKARVRREIEEQVERDERSYIPDPEENDQGEWARVDFGEIYEEPEPDPEPSDELTPEQRQVLRDL